VNHLPRPHHHSSYYYLEWHDAGVVVLGKMAWYDSPVVGDDEILAADQQTDSASSGWNQAMLWHLHPLHTMNDNRVQGEKSKNEMVLSMGVAAVTDQAEKEGLVNDDGYYFVIDPYCRCLKGEAP
jgi:hypothetical protein